MSPTSASLSTLSMLNLRYDHTVTFGKRADIDDLESASLRPRSRFFLSGIMLASCLQSISVSAKQIYGQANIWSLFSVVHTWGGGGICF